MQLDNSFSSVTATHPSLCSVPGEAKNTGLRGYLYSHQEGRAQFLGFRFLARNAGEPAYCIRWVKRTGERVFLCLQVKAPPERSLMGELYNHRLFCVLLFLRNVTCCSLVRHLACLFSPSPKFSPQIAVNISLPWVFF